MNRIADVRADLDLRHDGPGADILDPGRFLSEGGDISAICNLVRTMIDDSTYSIRVSTLSDSDAVSALLVASYSSLLAARYDSDALGRALPHMTRANPRLLASGTYYVAERELGNLVGCGGWTTAPPGSGEIVEREAHIRHFATHPEWVGRRVGASLLARCVSDARPLGIRKLHCFSTLNAEPFYRACGFKTIGPIDVPMGPSLFPAVLMRRELV
jgi:GNAT superfamily N-acetyltransferase